MTFLSSLVDLISAEVKRPLNPALASVAEAARERYGDGIVAVLIYGSCLRENSDEGKIVDIYLLAEKYSQIHGRSPMRWLNRWLPPNVYYLESHHCDRIVRAKYALLTLEHFCQLVAPTTLHPYFWARFAQPTALAWVRDRTTEQAVITALAQAVVTLVVEAAPLAPVAATSETFWPAAFAATYGTELRAERLGRAEELYRADRERYDQIFRLACQTTEVAFDANRAKPRQAARRKWRRRRYLGKTLSVLRLVKAAFSFQDGPDYLLWKVERHSGVHYQLSAWQRRHPLMAAPAVFWRLYRRGAFR